MFIMTASASQELRVDLEDFENNTAYACYRSFTVAGAASQYLVQVSSYSGTAGNTTLGMDSRHMTVIIAGFIIAAHTVMVVLGGITFAAMTT